MRLYFIQMSSTLRKLRGLVTYGPRQSLTSFDASKDELLRNGIEIKLARFHESRQCRKNRIACLIADVVILSRLVFGRYDFLILNSGASLFSRPRLFLCLLKISDRKKLATFVLWHNAAGQFEILKASLGPYWYPRVATALQRKDVHHLAVSEYTAGQVAAELGVSNSVCVYNCAKVPASLDHRSPENPPIILNVARVSERKNPDGFIKIAERVCKQYGTARFVWLGGKAARKLTEQINSLGLERNVDFVAFDPNPYEFMQRSSLLLLTSKEEAFGLVLAEAMACSRTTLCFADTGAAEVAGDTGYVVPQGDLTKASQIISEILQRSPEERVNEFARQRYEKLYSPEAYASRFESIVRTAMKARRSNNSS